MSSIGALALVHLLGACSSTTDTIGADPVVVPPPADAGSGGMGGERPVPPLVLRPLTGAASDTYPDPLHDEMFYDTATIEARVEDTFQQLFHGDPDNEAIYFTNDTRPADDPAIAADEGYIKDIYHDDVRTEGLGLGMLIAVELGHQDEFDKLWTYAKRELRISTGSNAGYFHSKCDAVTGSMNSSMQCIDPYGAQMFVMALIFAHDRADWAGGSIDYGSDALSILDVMLHKEEMNGGIVDGVTDTFDAETQYVFDVPNVVAASRTRPSILMPAFYELWTEATGDPFFEQAAASARGFLGLVANETTGLMPLRAYFDATPVPGSDTFTPEAYRVLPNMVLDALWTTDQQTSYLKELNRVLGFFETQGLSKYGTEYELDGTEVSSMTMHEPSLVFVNGMAAMLSTADMRTDFMQAVWDAKTPTGTGRYYQGIMQLFALLVLSGKMQVF